MRGIAVGSCCRIILCCPPWNSSFRKPKTSHLGWLAEPRALAHCSNLPFAACASRSRLRAYKPGSKSGCSLLLFRSMLQEHQPLRFRGKDKCSSLQLHWNKLKNILRYEFQCIQAAQSNSKWCNPSPVGRKWRNKWMWFSFICVEVNKDVPLCVDLSCKSEESFPLPPSTLLLPALWCPHAVMSQLGHCLHSCPTAGAIAGGAAPCEPSRYGLAKGSCRSRAAILENLHGNPGK